MAKVTSKLQMTLPKALADRYGVTPGVDLTFEPLGDSIRILIARGSEPAYVGLSPADKAALFGAVTRRQSARDRRHRRKVGAVKGKPIRTEERGWSRDELNERGRTR